jgi:hypothetical protein
VGRRGSSEGKVCKNTVRAPVDKLENEAQMKKRWTPEESERDRS